MFEWLKGIDWTKFRNWLIDGGALLIALIVDLGLNGIAFWIIAPDILTKIAMVLLAPVVVFFSVRGWVKRVWVLWLMFAIVATFSDVSLGLISTETQTDQSIEQAKDDPVLKQLETDKTDRFNEWKDAGQQYKDANNRKTLDQLDQQKKDALELYKTADKDLKEYKNQKDSGSGIHLNIAADKVFTAIPDALTSGKIARYIAFCFFLLIFSGLQITIIIVADVTIGPEAKQEEGRGARGKRVIKPSDREDWVSLNLTHGNRTDDGIRIMTEDEFVGKMRDLGRLYPRHFYKELRAEAVKRGVISERGILITEDEEELISRLA